MYLLFLPDVSWEFFHQVFLILSIPLSCLTLFSSLSLILFIQLSQGLGLTLKSFLHALNIDGIGGLNSIAFFCYEKIHLYILIIYAAEGDSFSLAKKSRREGAFCFLR